MSGCRGFPGSERVGVGGSYTRTLVSGALLQVVGFWPGLGLLVVVKSIK